MASRAVVAGAHQEPVEPGVEAVGVAQAAEVDPRLQQGVLDRVGSPVLLAQDESRGCQQASGATRGQRREGVDIPALRLDHQLTLHAIAFNVGGTSSALTESGAWDGQFIPSSFESHPGQGASNAATSPDGAPIGLSRHGFVGVSPRPHAACPGAADQFGPALAQCR